MKKITKNILLLFVFLSALLVSPTINAQLTINTGVTNAQLVAGFIGNGITISNITRNCPSGAYGTFSNGGSTNLGITNGSMFTTGDAIIAIGPNNYNAAGANNYATFSDPNLIAIEPSATNDPCILTFNVVPSCSTLTIRFVFGSEEYPEWVDSPYNDVFGFFVTGPNPSGGTYNARNIARIPTTTTGSNVVSINNINRGYYPDCSYSQNQCVNCAYYTNNCAGTSLQYDGKTTVITSNLNVIPCATYTFKIAIADAADHAYDSGVFIQQLYCSSAVTMTTSSSSTCSGCTGTATVNASNGQPPYTYSWSNGQTTPTATGLCAGNYTATVTDKTGCILNSNSAVVNVGSLTPGTASIQSSTNVSCFGGNTGSATATISGGTSPYTYLWSNGQTAQTATGLTVGNYTVTVTDFNKCTSTRTVAITQPAAALTSTVSVTNVACSGNPASATVTPAGGTSGYTYLWSGGQTTPSVSGLATGNYTVTVRDARNCSSQKTFNITITSTPSVIANSTQAGCTVANGTATAAVSGGIGATTYFWAPGGQNTQTATGLATGVYTVTVTKSGCPSITTTTVTATANPSVTTSATNTGCTVANGTATAFPTGGTGAHTYQWAPTGQTTQTATGLFAGVYTIIIRDANGCSDTETATVTSAGGPTATTSVNSHVSCFGGSDGIATVNPTGGTGAYTYSWSNGQTTVSATGLPAGTYVATVSDANGCIYSAAAIILTQPTFSLTATTTPQTNVSCFGGNDGVAIANPTGGTPGYTYLWAGVGQTTQAATGLSSGSYTVNIVDSKGCTTTNSVTISQPVAALTSTISAQINVSCNGGGDGSATANASGGTSGYFYVWNNGQSAQTATGLSAGSYTVTITDTKGCTAANAVTITQPMSPLTSSIFAQTNVLCFAGNSGSATASASGGTANYFYVWHNGQSAAMATGLSAGSYTVNITDAKGCTTIDSVLITQPTVGLSNTMSSQVNVSCFGGNDGQVTANPSGGTANYTYQWTNGQSTKTATGLSAGSYSVTITDAQGCTKVDTVSIQQPGINLAATTATQTNISCNGGSDGIAIVNPTGGTPPYSYLWSNGATTQNVTGLSQGTYSVIVSDMNGCDTASTIIITQPTPVSLAVSGNDSICPTEVSVLNAVSAGGTPGYSFSWAPGTQTGTSISVSPSTSTTYSIMVTDANGCTAAQQTFNVTVLPSPVASFTAAVAGAMFSSVFSFTDLSNGGVNWYWSFGDGSNSTLQNPTHTFPGTGTYPVMQIVYNQFNCPDTFRLEIDIPRQIIIPNVFTPDDNNTNDVFYIPNSGMKEFHLQIFNRWGILVFETTSSEIRWDGRTASGQLLSNGTYFVVLDATYNDDVKGDKKVKYTGYVTLLTKN